MSFLTDLFQDKWTMPPQAEALYNKLMAEYQGGNLGYSEFEKQGMLRKLREELKQQTGSAGSGILASAARRGMGMSGGQVLGSMTDLKASEGKAYGQGVTDVGLASAEAGRQRKGQIEGSLQGLASMSQMEPAAGPGILGGLFEAGTGLWKFNKLKDLYSKFQGGGGGYRYPRDPRYPSPGDWGW